MDERERRVLLEKLEHEKVSRLQQETLISKLKKEQSELRTKLAQAEGHIDKMRFGANVEIREHYIVSHKTRQDVTLQQKVRAQGPSKEKSNSITDGVAQTLVSIPDFTDEHLQYALQMPQSELAMGEMVMYNYFGIACLGNQPGGNEGTGNVSPSEISVELTPRSGSFSLQPSDSDQNSDNSISWLANITPPLWDSDSSNSDSDMELAKEAIHNESITLAEMCGIFDCLDQLQSSKSGSRRAAGSTDGHMTRDKLVNGQVCLKLLFNTMPVVWLFSPIRKICQSLSHSLV